jgi:hypothetical protein
MPSAAEPAAPCRSFRLVTAAAFVPANLPPVEKISRLEILGLIREMSILAE